MDNNNIAVSPTNNNANTKSPEADDFEIIKTQIHGVSGGVKPFSYTNRVLKRHRPNHNFHNPPPHHAVVVTYRECLKNHAATLGGHALDGCGEFMPSPATNPTDPTSLKCAACGCHRNFHRRDPEESSSPPLQQLLLPQPLSTNASHVIEYQPHHRHHPPPPSQPHRGGSPPPQSPPPISSSYYPSSAPHMLLALSTGLSTPHPPPENHPHPQQLHQPVGHLGTISATTANGAKRFRTKFSPVQKEKMYQLAERVGWKMQKKDEDLVAQFCKDSGVDRSVFKVWMHNNKNTFSKKQPPSDVNNGTSRNSNGLNLADQITSPHASHNENIISSHHHHSEGSENVGTHGSSSSS